jgi:hypothetical protein
VKVERFVLGVSKTYLMRPSATTAKVSIAIFAEEADGVRLAPTSVSAGTDV